MPIFFASAPSFATAIDPVYHHKAQAKMEDVVSHFTPVYEPERPGSFFLDMAGTERLFGKAMDAAARVQAEIARGLGVPLSVGVAENKLVAQVAARLAHPMGLCDIFAGEEAAFLAPLKLDYLPAFHDFQDPADLSLFRELAISRIGDVAWIPPAVLTRILGQRAERLQRQAMGIDPTPVWPPKKERAIEEDVELAAATNDDAALLGRLWAAVQSLARRLRGLGTVAAEARLDAVQADGKLLHERQTLVPPSDGDFSLFAALRKIWPRFLKRRVAIRSLRLTLAGLRPVFHQLNFEGEGRERTLISALDHIRDRYGRDAIRIER